MSGESFSVNTTGLEAQMPYMDELAQRFRSVHERLEARLGALGEPWGDDVNGEQFLRQYERPREQIVQAAGEAGDVLRSAGDGLITMARGYERIEGQNMDAARHLDPATQPATPSEGRGGSKGGPHS